MWCLIVSISNICPFSYYEHDLLNEWSVVDRHRRHFAAIFGVFVDGGHCKLPT